MSLPPNQLCSASGPVLTTITSEQRVRGIMRLSGLLRIGGSESSIVVGKTIFRTTSRCIRNRCSGGTRPGSCPGPPRNPKASILDTLPRWTENTFAIDSGGINVIEA
jgi:hypothetical protein